MGNGCLIGRPIITTALLLLQLAQRNTQALQREGLELARAGVGGRQQPRQRQAHRRPSLPHAQIKCGRQLKHLYQFLSQAPTSLQALGSKQSVTAHRTLHLTC